MEMLDNYWENTWLGRNNYVNDKKKVMEMLDNDWENTWLGRNNNVNDKKRHGNLG